MPSNDWAVLPWKMNWRAMKKKVIKESLELLERSYKVKAKSLDAEWRAIHASANVLMIRYALYVKVRKKKGKNPMSLKEWLDAGKPDK
jgi:hypothetical protein